MKKEKSCGAVIFDHDKVLLIKQSNGDWGFPKGHVEGDETEMETSIREVKEETNIDIEVFIDKKYTISYEISESILKEVVYFVAKPLTNELLIQPNEILDAKWLDFNSAIKTITHDRVRNVLKSSIKDMNKKYCNL